MHKQGREWVWTQVGRNGRPSAFSPGTYDTEGSAKRAAERQVAVLNRFYIVTAIEDLPTELRARLLVSEGYRRP